ncbi:hypothetical protein TRFO_02806 [Tritrichomonas foetus]|uniref:Protein kinase domain-containing protein n=1 Tax=Tritrichomonas foetus TaxID=1144522 RepID=A0A1J4KW04_9EUKA|nr:hypothetical protein TRFO_02806 [Tritrichomonas foetus]|eukprot:OHT15497.1 hypothetical protein TRFO_02806 [Tritrichomonas foetus]
MTEEAQTAGEPPLALQVDGVDINVPMDKNKIKVLGFFKTLNANCIFTSSSDAEFPTIFESAKLDPLVTYSFTTENDIQFFTFCTQNLVCVVEIDDIEKFKGQIKKLDGHNLLPSISKDDFSALKDYLNSESVTCPHDAPDMFHDSNAVKSHFTEHFISPAFGDSWTVSRFLYISLNSVLNYAIRRFYYPTDAYDDPSFFGKFYTGKFTLFKIYDRFLEIRSFAQGGTGTVSLGIHKSSGYLVAMKLMLAKSHIKNDPKLKRYNSELNFYKTHRHPSIVHCFGYCKHGNNAIFIQDYMCNGSLKKYCQGEPLDPTLKTQAVLQILFGIDYLHSTGFIHRDIKPDNVLIDHNNNYFLSDFDTTRVYVGNKRSTWTGTDNYKAPEYVKGGEYSFQIDLYSFGIIVYELCVGKNPFSGLSILEATQRVSDGTIDMVSYESGAIFKLFRRCTAAVAESRATSFYLLNMFTNERLYFAGTDDDYIVKKTNEIMTTREEVTELKERKDVEYIEESAANGEVYAQFNLGVMYHNGWVYDRDYTKALYWFELAAEQNHRAAIYDIANMYYRSRGVPRDLRKAFDYFKRAADMKFVEAFNGLGLMYYHGEVPSDEVDENGNPILLPPNYEKAREYFTYAAENGHSYARCNLGHIYYYGKLGTPDYEKAVFWYNKAVDQSNPDAECNLGNIYFNGLVGDGPDYSKAFELYKKAQAHNQLEACFRLGKMYRDGIAVEKDVKEAANIFKKGSEKGDIESSIALSELVLDREIDDVNDDEVVTCLQKSLQKNPKVEQRDKIIQLLKKASELGNERATQELEQLQGK